LQAGPTRSGVVRRLPLCQIPRQGHPALAKGATQPLSRPFCTARGCAKPCQQGRDGL